MWALRLNGFLFSCLWCLSTVSQVHAADECALVQKSIYVLGGEDVADVETSGPDEDQAAHDAKVEELMKKMDATVAGEATDKAAEPEADEATYGAHNHGFTINGQHYEFKGAFKYCEMSAFPEECAMAMFPEVFGGSLQGVAPKLKVQKADKEPTDGMSDREQMLWKLKHPHEDSAIASQAWKDVYSEELDNVDITKHQKLRRKVFEAAKDFSQKVKEVKKNKAATGALSLGDGVHNPR
eukprot:gnl/TRDRNA2_/TRDRNA2_180454_c0_seq1.p1 gnl/TRDRNA2_/TRDRNA2_180454_c0~~gnl/TRDRNA2_/TRDRNA2_180454_c0_seq1.p1  ORF type:complete len:239 (-),score=59.71 gnl/TRDRNA2_/TRDRNA2_180454_c0_seq1:28-744(-)